MEILSSLFQYFIKLLPWLAILFLSLGYWKQIWHIHIHKEVRDFNIKSYIYFMVAYIALCLEAYSIDSLVFIWKNIILTIQTGILIYQIKTHQGDKWRGLEEYKQMKHRASTKESIMMHKKINLKKDNPKE